MKHVIRLVDTGEDFLCAEDQHLLQGMQNYRIGRKMLRAIPVGCRGGGCGVCRIRIHSGDYQAKKMSCKHITSEDRVGGVALACRIYPRSELCIEVLPNPPQQQGTAQAGGAAIDE